MKRIALFVLPLLALGALPAPSYAQQGSYCAIASPPASYQNCYYYSFQQCQAAISGVGGHCQINPAAGRRSGLWWEDEQDEPRPATRRKRYRRY